MKKLFFAILPLAAALAVGCGTTSTTSVTPVTSPTGTVTYVTNTTTSQTLNADDIAAIDSALSSILSNAPAALADAATISALVHPTNSPSAPPSSKKAK
jgi:hypothetical protein